MKETEFKPGIWKHYKGGYYRALMLVEHHETCEKFVVYVSLTYGSLKIREWATPGKDSWTDKIEKQWSVGHHDARETVPRFEYVGGELP